MKLPLIIKLNFLVLALGLAIYFMTTLKDRGISPTALQVVGLAPSHNEGRSAKFVGSVDLCDTRVKALVWPQGLAIEQQGFKWLAQNGAQQELDFIAVEKWFGRNCKVQAEFVGPEAVDQASLVPALLVKYIKGADRTLRRAADGVFVWGKQAFRSGQLESALKEIEKYPVAKVSK